MNFPDAMARYHGEISRNADAAAQVCPEKIRGECKNTRCGFHRAGFLHPCKLTDLEIVLEVAGYAVGSPEEHRPPGLCPHGEEQGKETLCTETFGACQYQVWKPDPMFVPALHIVCGLEAAALVVAEAAEESGRLK